jgi:hypothetical protein
MPSPFPGMDPFIEMEEWSDFHGAMIFAFRAQLAPKLRPKYVVRAETRVYLERSYQEAQQFQPDVRIAKSGRKTRHSETGSPRAAVAELELFDIPMPEEFQEHYLVIRDRDRREVVTVIEVLSPANKRTGSDGHREYNAKRDELLCRHVHLVEVDLLRGGTRPASIQSLSPATDYCVFIHRVELRPKAQVLQWTMRDALPEVRIPLSHGDPDVFLDMQAAFAEAFEGGEYDVTIDYGARLQPPLRKGDLLFLKQLLAKQRE